MTRDELLEKLYSVEWDDIEFKEATWAIPKSALETVSAFANTRGGHIVFGVSEGNGALTITGVTDVDKLQNDFLGQTRDSQKISVILPVSGQVHKLPEGTVICFYIPEASRAEKPVYLDRNPKKAYVRRGGGDYGCTGDELMRFIRDAGGTPYDSETLELEPATFYDETTLRWYRARFEASNPGKDGSVDDITFLRNWGLLVEKDGELLPTRAAVLVVGAAPLVRQQLPRIVVDLQLYRHTANEYSPAARWADRVTVEANLIDAWKAILDFFQKHSERPFSVDPATLRRHDDPPDYISFREAAINLLIHQDFGDATRVPVIRFFKDRTEFFNPGDAFASREQLLDPGDKEVRNPRIVGAFRRIGLSDQGGTGVAAIFDSWRRLGFLPPEIENDKAEKSFRLRLRRERLLSEEQLLAQASLGVQLSEAEAAVFAFLIRKGEADLADIKGLTGLSGPSALELAQRLSTQVIVRQVPGPRTKFVLADHLQERYLRNGSAESFKPQRVSGAAEDASATEQVTEQVGEKPTDQVSPLRELSSAQWAIVAHADAPRSLAELMQIAGYTQRPHFKAAHLEPLIAGGILRMTVPDKPTSSKQRYVLTQAGLKLKALRLELDARKPEKEDAE
jgi:ATP-dependent DNA helicase RecG